MFFSSYSLIKFYLFWKMKKICLVNGGDFVLGIDTQYILSRQIGGKPVQPVTAEEGGIFHLGSLLSRRSCDVVAPDSVLLHLRKGGETFFLLVDRIIDEIELSEAPISLPPASPALAEQLCPQVVVCGNLVVLLLDPSGIIPVSQQLGAKVGWVTEENFFVPPEEPEQEGLECEEEGEKDKDGPEPQHDVTAEAEAKDKTGHVLAGDSERRQEKATAVSVNEETFKNVMTWTIAQFKQGKVGNDNRLGMEQLPPDLVQQKGLSDTVIQYLIDQIALRCQESMNRSRPGENHGD
jgi:hypothetical protein